MHWRRKWQPTPVLLPGESHGWRSLVGCSPWGRRESDTTERHTRAGGRVASQSWAGPWCAKAHSAAGPQPGPHRSAGSATNLAWGGREAPGASGQASGLSPRRGARRPGAAAGARCWRSRLLAAGPDPEVPAGTACRVRRQGAPWGWAQSRGLKLLLPKAPVGQALPPLPRPPRSAPGSGAGTPEHQGLGSASLPGTRLGLHDWPPAALQPPVGPHPRQEPSTAPGRVRGEQGAGGPHPAPTR